MSDEEKDVKRMLLQIDALAAARRRRPKNRPGFLHELDNLADAKSKPFLDLRTRLRLRFFASGNWLGGRAYRLVVGHDRPEMDIATSARLEDLHERREISSDEFHTCRFWRIVRRKSDGHVQVSEQPKSLQILGKVLIAPIAIGLAYALTSFLNQFFSIWNLALWGFPIGAVLGKTSRFLYFSTWGWKGTGLKL